MPAQPFQAQPDLGDDQMSRIGGQVIMTLPVDCGAEACFGGPNFKLVIELQGYSGAVKARTKIRRGGRDRNIGDNADGDSVGRWSGGRGCQDYLPSTRMTDRPSSTTARVLLASRVLASSDSFAR